jgi:tetratricopeptide (TPR) repeat protein
VPQTSEAAKSDDRLKADRKKIESLIKAGDKVSAEKKLRELVKQNPNSVSLICRLIHLTHALGRREEAAAFLVRAQSLEPDNAQVLYIAGKIARIAGRHGVAVQYWLLVPPNSKEYRRARLAAARLQISRGRISHAVKFLKDGIAEDAAFLEGRLLLDDLYIRQQWYGASAHLWQQALNSEPDNREYRDRFLESLARLAMQNNDVQNAQSEEVKGRPLKALAIWRKITQSARDIPVPQFRLAASRHVQMNSRGSALQLIDGTPEKSTLRYLFNQIDEAVNRPNLKRIARLRSTFKSHPAGIYLDFKLLASHQCYEPALSLAPQLEALLFKTGREGVSYLTSVLAREARCAMALGRVEDALGALARLLAIDSEQTRVAMNLLWRIDPAAALEYASKTSFCTLGSAAADSLFCFLPILLGDVTQARSNLNLQYTRYAASGENVSAELLVCDAIISAVEKRCDRYAEALNGYFGAYSLSRPLHGGYVRGKSFFEQLAICEPPRTEPVTEANPLVSVIVTVFNGQKTIDYAVKSILGQSYRKLEIIVVDDASTDETPHHLSNLALQDSRIRVIRNETNRGTYVSKNEALLSIKGKYFVCHDADDWAHPDRIARHVALMEANPELVASESDWLRVDDEGMPQIRITKGLFKHPNPASPFYLARATMEAIGFYDCVRIDADYDHWRRVVAHFGLERTARIRCPLTLGRSHPETLTRTGAGAMSDEYYSKARSDYRYDRLLWRLNNVEHSLKADFGYCSAVDAHSSVVR